MGAVAYEMRLRLSDPTGTGKTATAVEATVQAYLSGPRGRKNRRKVLVTAVMNSTADLLCHAISRSLGEQAAGTILRLVSTRGRAGRGGGLTLNQGRPPPADA